MKELKKALTFDDILLVPAHSSILPKEVNLTSKLTKKITLNKLFPKNHIFYVIAHYIYIF